MKKFLAAAILGACTLTAAAQMSTTTVTQANGKNGKPLPSPRMMTTAQVGKVRIDIDYGAPAIKGRPLTEVAPAGKIWRAGANEATGIATTGDLMIGKQHVPAGKYTLYAMPSTDGWWLVINKQTGQWGLTYNQDQDLGRVKLSESSIASPATSYQITIENIHGSKAELHLKWGQTDLSTPIMAH